MILLGLAGQAGSGKDTVADYLVKHYGFVKFSFSDALYREVAEAFRLEDESLLRDRETKDTRTDLLRLDFCSNEDFVDLAIDLAMAALDEPIDLGPLILKRALSPRQILQWWGAEYRRAQDPDYWIYKTGEWMDEVCNAPFYSEHVPQFFVNTSVRFSNEQEWIRGHGSSVWHLHRDTARPVHTHESENPLPVLEGEREIWNNAGIEQLYAGVDLLLSSNVGFVRCEPMETPALPNGQYFSTQSDGYEMLCNADGTRSIFDDVDQ